jgi:hypothetical protein
MLDFADSIDETASRIGVSTDALQEWTFAAKQAGVSSEKLQGFIERLSAAAADSKKSKLFAAMGVDPGQTPEGLFRSVQARTQGKAPTEVIKMLAEIIGDFRQIGPMMNLLTGDLDAASASARKLGAVIDGATIKRFAALNDQLSIVGQILMGNFAPAIITAGKAALAAFKGVQGAAGWLGARTMGLQDKDLVRAAMRGVLFGPVGFGKSLGAAMDSADNKWPGAKDSANSEWKKSMDELDAVLARLTAYVAPVNPAIVAGGESDKKAKGAAVGGNSDALIAVGNFLGAGRANIDSVARETNRILKEHTTYLRQIAMKNATLDIGVPN